MFGVLLVSKFGMVLVFSLVKTEENCSFKSSAFSDASAYVFPSFFNGATPEPSHFLLLINEYSFLLLVPLSSETMFLT